MTDPRNADRDERILSAATALARRLGYRNLTRRSIAEQAGISEASVSNFGRTRITNGDHPRGQAVVTEIRDALMARAVADGDLVVLAQGLADRHPAALAAPAELRVMAVVG